MVNYGNNSRINVESTRVQKNTQTRLSKNKKRDTLYVYNLTCDLGVGLEIERSWVQFLEFRPPGNNLRQVVHTRASVTKQYNLV